MPIEKTYGSVNKLLSLISRVETFSGAAPGTDAELGNPTINSTNVTGQITSGLRENALPDLTSSSINTSAQSTAMKGIDSLSGDGRLTPGAFQVSLANYDNKFGIWRQQNGETWTNDGEALSKKSIALSSDVLSRFFDINVNSHGSITSISAASASVLLEDPAIATSGSWSVTNNPLIGLNINNFQQQQYSLILAGKSINDTNIHMSLNTRTAPTEVQQNSLDFQAYVAKNFIYDSYNSVIRNNPNNSTYFEGMTDFKTDFEKVLFGKTMHITSSISAFGISAGQTFDATLNAAFLCGSGYVSGFYGKPYTSPSDPAAFGARYFAKTLYEAYHNGSATMEMPDVNNGTKLTTVIYNSGDGSFSISGTPVNVNTTYPSGLHYGAILSTVGTLNFDDPTLWDVSGTAFSMGYTGYFDSNSSFENITLDASSGNVVAPSAASQYDASYKSIGNNTISFSGSSTYEIDPYVSSTTVLVLDSNNPNSAAPLVENDQQIDISFLNTSWENLNGNLFYRYYNGSNWVASSINSPNVPNGQPCELIYIDNTGLITEAEKISAIENSTPDIIKFHVTVSDVSKFNTPTQNSFIYSSASSGGGSGTLDLSATTGIIDANIDESISTVKLGTGRTYISDDNETNTTYELNANMSEGSSAIYIGKFDLQNGTADKIDLTTFGDIKKDSLTISSLSFNSQSDVAGSAVGGYYDQYSYSAVVSFAKTVNGVDKNYRFEVGFSGDIDISSNVSNWLKASVIYTEDGAPVTPKSTLTVTSLEITPGGFKSALNVANAIEFQFTLTDHSSVVSATQDTQHSVQAGAFWYDPSQLSFNDSNFDLIIQAGTNENEYTVTASLKPNIVTLSNQHLILDLSGTGTTPYTFNYTYRTTTQARQAYEQQLLSSSPTDSEVTSMNNKIRAVSSDLNIYGATTDQKQIFINEAPNTVNFTINAMKSSGSDITWSASDNAVVVNAYVSTQKIALNSSYLKFAGLIDGGANGGNIVMSGAGKHVLALEDFVTQNMLPGSAKMFANIKSITASNSGDIVDLSSTTLHASLNGAAININGGDGNDTIYCGLDSAIVNGGGGADTIVGGMANDVFQYNNITDSTSSSMDKIFNFVQGDKISLASSVFSNSSLVKIENTTSSTVHTLYYDYNENDIIDSDELQIEVHGSGFNSIVDDVVIA